MRLRLPEEAYPLAQGSAHVRIQLPQLTLQPCCCLLLRLQLDASSTRPCLDAAAPQQAMASDLRRTRSPREAAVHTRPWSLAASLEV